MKKHNENSFKNILHKIIEKIRDRPGLVALVLIGVLTGTTRFLFAVEMGHTALLYVALPFFIAIFLLAFTRTPTGSDLKSSYWRTVRTSLIVLFGSSALLHEGFLCVLFVIPIYLILVTLSYIYAYFHARVKSRSGKLYSSIIPVLVVLSSLEGVLPELSFDRKQLVSVNLIVPLTPEQIRYNLMQPMVVPKSSNFFLALFPMPKQIDAGSLEVGDLHEVHYKYNRWIFTNSHIGRTVFKIAESSDTVIRLELIEDTSYISHYMRVNGTQITLEPIDDSNTRVTLKVDFERSLDPAWYFTPLERYGVEKMSELILSEVISHDR